MFLRSIITAIFVGVFSITHAGVIKNSQGENYQEIIISSKATPMVKLAAKELQKFITKTCNTSIPIVTDNQTAGKTPYILVGESDFTNQLKLTTQGLKKEGFRIVSTPKYLAILGRDHQGKPISIQRNPWRKLEVYNKKLGLCAFGEAGTLYGVYRFLEDQLGVRWYWPNKYGTVIQPKEKVVIPEFKLTDAPKFNYRYPWYCLGEVDGDQLLWLRRARFGGTVPVYIMHSFDHFQKYIKSHPEYFALVDGKRDFDSLCTISGGGHLCLTNPDVIKQYVKDIREYFDKNPKQRFYPLVPMDGLTRVCGCPKCQAEIDRDKPNTGDFSNHIWGFVNKVAIELAKTHPDKIVGCIAYKNYTDPPSRISKLSPNVAVMICYKRNFIATPLAKNHIRKILLDWKKLSSNIYTWNWYLEHWRSWKGLPLANTQLIKDDYKFLDSLKVWKGEFIEAENNVKGKKASMAYPASQHINLYLSGRAMWNPDFNLQKTMDEYYRLFYGLAEKEMREFWQLSEKSFMKAAANIDRPNERLVAEDAYPPEVLNQLSLYLNEALKKTAKDSVYHKRLLQVEKEFLPARKSLTQLISSGNRKMEAKRVSGVADLKTLTLQRFVTKHGLLPDQQSYFSVGWNSKNLYFTFYCSEAKMKSLKMKCTKRDKNKIFGDDCMEIFISPDTTQPENSFHFCINANGTIWDARHFFGGVYSKKWNCKNIKAKVTRQVNRWILRVIIPVDSLDIKKISPNQEFLVNFYRSRVADKKQAYSCWSPIFAPAHFTPSRFGKLKFISSK